MFGIYKSSGMVAVWQIHTHNIHTIQSVHGTCTLVCKASVNVLCESTSNGIVMMVFLHEVQKQAGGSGYVEF